MRKKLAQLSQLARLWSDDLCVLELSSSSESSKVNCQSNRVPAFHSISIMSSAALSLTRSKLSPGVWVDGETFEQPDWVRIILRHREMMVSAYEQAAAATGTGSILDSRSIFGGTKQQTKLLARELDTAHTGGQRKVGSRPAVSAPRRAENPFEVLTRLTLTHSLGVRSHVVELD